MADKDLKRLKGLAQVLLVLFGAVGITHWVEFIWLDGSWMDAVNGTLFAGLSVMEWRLAATYQRTLDANEALANLNKVRDAHEVFTDLFSENGSRKPIEEVEKEAHDGLV